MVQSHARVGEVPHMALSDGVACARSSSSLLSALAAPSFSLSSAMWRWIVTCRAPIHDVSIAVRPVPCNTQRHSVNASNGRTCFRTSGSARYSTMKSAKSWSAGHFKPVAPSKNGSTPADRNIRRCLPLQNTVGETDAHTAPARKPHQRAPSRGPAYTT